MNNNIKVYLRRNATATAAEAPYTWGVIPNGVANLNDIVADMLERLNSSDERIRMVIREAVSAAIKRARNGETVDIGCLRLKPRIPGSMPYEDSPFDTSRDELIVEVYADAELSDVFDGVVPGKVSADDFAAATKVSNVMDVATEHFGEIHGTNTFEVLGNGITLDGESEGVKLLDKKTDAALAAATVDSVSKGQRAKCHFAAAEGGVAKGAYTLEVTTFGLVGETTPRVFRKPVTLVEPIPESAPTVRITKVYDQEGNEDNICYYDGVAHIMGENLMLLPGDTVKLRGTDWETHETIEHVFDDAVYNAETGKIDITVGPEELGRFESEPGADVIVTSRGGVSGSVPQVATRHVTLAGE